jgi:curved DNA-binding protein CbpA
MTATRVPDYYQLLGVSPDATISQIKKAYRKLARQHHPDANPGDPDAAARFRDITGAYGTLTDPARRTAYDRQHGPFTRTTTAGNGTTRPDGTAGPDIVKDPPEAISRVLAILEDIWRAIRARHPPGRPHRRQRNQRQASQMGTLRPRTLDPHPDRHPARNPDQR